MVKPYPYANLGWLCLLLGLYSCSEYQNDTYENPLEGFFFIRYSEQNKQLKAQAYFEGIDDLDPTKKTRKSLLGGVSFAAVPMKVSSDRGISLSYKLEQPWAWEDVNPSFTFRHQGTQIEVFCDSIATFSNFLVKHNQVSKRSGGVLQGDFSLAKQEQLVIWIIDQKHKVSEKIFNGPANLSEIILGPNLMNGLQPGPVNIQCIKKLKRQQTLPLINTHLRIEYYSIIKSGELIP